MELLIQGWILYILRLKQKGWKTQTNPYIFLVIIYEVQDSLPRTGKANPPNKLRATWAILTNWRKETFNTSYSGPVLSSPGLWWHLCVKEPHPTLPPCPWDPCVLGKGWQLNCVCCTLPLSTDALPSSASRGQHQIIQRVTDIQRKGVLSFAVSDIYITLTFK